MDTFRKLAIIPVDDRFQMRQKELANYNPEMRAVTQLREEIDTILARTDISPEDRLALVQAASHRMQSFNIKNLSERRDTVQTPQSGRTVTPNLIPPTDATAPAQRDHLSTSAATIDLTTGLNIVESVPKQFKDKASSLLAYLDNFPEDI